MRLRDLARAAALRAARQLPPDARNALDGLRWLFAGHYGGLAQLPERMGYLVSIERRFLALGAERDGLQNRLACAVEMAAQAEHERDALRLGLAEHLAALEEVRARLAAEQRGAALLVAQREAQQAIAEAAVKKLGEAGERAKAAAAHEQELIDQINAAHVVLQGAGMAPGKLAARCVELASRAAAAHRRAREAEERLRAAQLAAEGGG